MTITDKQVEAALIAEEYEAQRLMARVALVDPALTMRAALEAAEAVRECVNPQHIAADIVRSCAAYNIDADAMDVLAAVERALDHAAAPSRAEQDTVNRALDDAGDRGLQPPSPGAPEADERQARINAAIVEHERIGAGHELDQDAYFARILSAADAARAKSSAAPVSARDAYAYQARFWVALHDGKEQWSKWQSCTREQHEAIQRGETLYSTKAESIALYTHHPADARDGGTRTLSDEQLAAILARPVCEGESVEFYLADSCAVPAYPECTRLMMHEVIRTILAPADRAMGGE